LLEGATVVSTCSAAGGFGALAATEVMAFLDDSKGRWLAPKTNVAVNQLCLPDNGLKEGSAD
jgi:hypothetical protein